MRLEANHGDVGAGGKAGKEDGGGGWHGQAGRWAKWWGVIWAMVKSHDAGGGERLMHQSRHRSCRNNNVHGLRNEGV